MIFVLILAAVVLLLYLVLLQIKISHMDKCTQNIPGEKKIPLLGNVDIFFQIKDMRDAYILGLRILKTYKEQRIIKLWFGPILGIGIWDARYVEMIANSPHAVQKGNFYTAVLGDVFHGVVISDTGQKWKELRKPLVKSLTRKSMIGDYHNVFVKRCNGFADYIKEEKLDQEFDVLRIVSNLLLDMFSETHLGVPTNEVIEQKYNWVEHFHKFFDSTVLNIITCHFYFKKIGEYVSKVGSTIRESRGEMNTFLQWVLDERLNHSSDIQGDGSELYSDFLVRRSFEKKIPMTEVRRELADMVLAASDTSSIVTSSALLFLAMFPEAQEEAFQEQISILGDCDKEPTSADLESMVYLKMVIKETLRLIGVPGIFRQASDNITLDKYTIPKGAMVYVFLKGLHSDPEYWEKPNQFYPDHFLPEREATRHRYAFAPFGVAPRMCAGFQYGMNSIMVIISKVLRNFTLSTSMKYDELVFSYKLLLHSHNGYNVRFNLRNKT